MPSLVTTRNTLSYVHSMIFGESIPFFRNEASISRYSSQFFMSIFDRVYLSRQEVKNFLAHTSEHYPALNVERAYVELNEYANTSLASQQEMVENSIKIRELAKKTLTRSKLGEYKAAVREGFKYYLSACEDGNLQVIQAYNEHRQLFLDTFTPTIHYSPVAHFCQFGHFELLKEYLEPLSPEKRRELLCMSDEFGMTPFLMACAKGHCDIIEYLAVNETYVLDQETMCLENGLYIAAINKKLHAVNTLIKYVGLEAFDKTLHCGTSYFEALCYYKDPSIFRFLRDHVPGCLGKNKRTFDAFWHCCNTGKKQLAKIVYYGSEGKVVSYNFDSCNVFTLALLEEKLDLFNYISKLSKKSIATVMAMGVGHEGRTVMHQICQHGSKEIIAHVMQQLDEQRASSLLTRRNQVGRTPISYLLERDFPCDSIFENLSSRTIKDAFTSLDIDQNSAAHIAAREIQLPLLNIIARDCPTLLTAQNKLGHNFLQHVALHRQPNYLLEWLKGCELNLSQNQGLSQSQFKCKLIFEANGALASGQDDTSAFHLMISSNEVEAMKLALSMAETEEAKKELVLIENTGGYNAFEFALSYGNKDTVQTVYQVCKEEFFDPERHKKTSFLAGVNPHEDVLEWLYETRGPCIFNEESSTGHNLFLFFCEDGQVDRASWVLEKVKEHNTEHGVSTYISKKDNSLRNALALSISGEKTEVTEWLLKEVSTLPYCGGHGYGNLMFEVANLSHTKPHLDLLYKDRPHVVRHQLKQKDRKERTPFLFACADGNFEVAKAFYEITKEDLDAVDHEGCNAMHLAMKSGSLDLVKWIYSLAPHLLDKQKTTGEKEYPYELIKDSCIAVYLIEEVRLPINNQVKAGLFVDHIAAMSDEIKDEIFFSDAIYHILPYKTDLMDDLSEKIAEFLDDFDMRKIKPCVIKTQESLKGDALVAFYNEKIPDVEFEAAEDAILNNFQHISKEQYQQALNAGSDEGSLVSVEEAKEKLQAAIEETKKVLDKIKHNKADAAVPVRKEEFYYLHLKRILKHLAKELKSAKIEDRLTYLEDLRFGNMCYTHYSTVLHNVYARISGDNVFASVSLSEDDPAKRFETALLAKFSEKLQKPTGQFLSFNVHDIALYRAMFEEAGIPHILPDLIDQPSQRDAALMRMHQAQFGVELTAIYDNTYEVVKTKTIANFFEHHVKPIETYLLITKFIEDGLSVDHPKQTEFLEELTEWFTKSNIPADEALSYEIEDTAVTYRVKHDTFVRHLHQFPMFALA